MSKKLFSIILCIVMVASLLAGCGGTTPAQSTAPANSNQPAAQPSHGTKPADGDDELNFVIIVKSYQSTYWLAAVKGAQDQMKVKGVNATFNGPNSESDIADQVQMFNDAINSKPDGIGLAACDPSAMLDALQAAKEAGIPVIAFDSGIPNAPAGSVLATASTDNYKAGQTAAEGMWKAIENRVKNASGKIRIGVVNQDATSESITSRGLGFIDKITELCKSAGKKTAVIGNDLYVGKAKDKGDEASADVIIEVRVPAQTTTELCATEASAILNQNDTIGIFGSNQVAAEGILTANQNLGVLGSTDNKIIAVGFDAGSIIKAAVKDGTMYGAVTQSPLKMGEVTIDLLIKAAKGEPVSDVDTGGAWYNKDNMEDPSIAPNLYD